MLRIFATHWTMVNTNTRTHKDALSYHPNRFVSMNTEPMVQSSELTDKEINSLKSFDFIFFVSLSHYFRSAIEDFQERNSPSLLAPLHWSSLNKWNTELDMFCKHFCTKIMVNNEIMGHNEFLEFLECPKDQLVLKKEQKLCCQKSFISMQNSIAPLKK